MKTAAQWREHWDYPHWNMYWVGQMIADMEELERQVGDLKIIVELREQYIEELGAKHE